MPQARDKQLCTKPGVSRKGDVQREVLRMFLRKTDYERHRRDIGVKNQPHPTLLRYRGG